MLQLVMKFNVLTFLALLFINFFVTIPTVRAESEKTETIQATVQSILEEKEVASETHLRKYQKLQLQVTSGTDVGKIIIIENGNEYSLQQITYKPGDKLFISKFSDGAGDFTYLIAGVNRSSALWLLFAIFIFMSILVGSKKGLLSLFAMGVSFLVLFFVIIPSIQQGNDPTFSTILGSLIIIPVTFYLSHGFDKKTSVAVLGTLIAIVITGILSYLFVNLTQLTGMIDEETMMLQARNESVMNLKGLLLAGIIIGALGVLDDITTSQAAVAFQLYDVNNRLTFWELFRRSTEVGKDHIASMINTLVLAYTGASLPLILLFTTNPRPIVEILNFEMMTAEIVRTLVGSIGLIVAVPITNFIACLALFSKKNDQRHLLKDS